MNVLIDAIFAAGLIGCVLIVRAEGRRKMRQLDEMLCERRARERELEGADR